MAETEERSLDNFFAKRDKKKKKERSNRAAAAGPAGGAGAGPAATAPGGTAGARPAEGGAAPAGPAGPAVAVPNRPDEDEWKEFEQKEIDYSGLRVQAMQISEKEDEENEKREEPGDNWEEAGGGGVEKASGPWNKTAPAQAPAAPVIVTEAPEPVPTGGVYRPPGARVTTTRKTPQGPPEIYSDTQFPSLQSTAKHVESRKDKEMEKSFEVVKDKNRGRGEVSKNQALKLQLDNQYAVLGDQ
ncbi:protein CDV3 homolog isoform X2 [Ornithorhynchus anatinus]|uniref:protein CDV3 homolog isoform X2 n=1 Tax=Ornithorhynchus anatinus TaxID=9258 RepID=UPI0019D42F51|nr:protein CDV3 homolog isoform X2 [Ornithorhynchus anatinus]